LLRRDRVATRRAVHPAACPVIFSGVFVGEDMTGFVENFSLPDVVRDELKLLVGQDSVVDSIELACQRYLTLTGAQQLETPHKAANKMLLDLHNCASTLATILEDKTIKNELGILVLSEPYSRSVSGYRAKLKEMRKNLTILARITEGVKPLSRGRQKGQNNKAGRHLAYSLYMTCQGAGLHVKRVNVVSEEGHTLPDGLLHNILGALRKPLNLGPRELNGIFDSVITAIEADNS